jgi:NhaP-type Na+/H+ or K+/H+ antiporter
MLLNISVFLWYGAVCPWASFRTNNVIPLYRLIPLGIMVLLFRRLPMVIAFHKKIPEIEELQQAAFVGFFGPIGVSAIFYLYVSVDFLHHVTVDGEQREDARHLEEVMRVVIWFLAICSIVVHGLSIPIGKMGYHLPRTMSQALSSEREDQAVILSRQSPDHIAGDLRRRRNHDRQPSTGVFQIGRPSQPSDTRDLQSAEEPARPIRFIDSAPASGTHTPIDTQEEETSARNVELAAMRKAKKSGQVLD